MQALIDAAADKSLDARIVYVACNHSGAAALDRAARAGIPSGVFAVPDGYPSRRLAQQAMAEAIAGVKPGLVVLAGFDRILEDVVFEKLAGIPLINIHPSLLPAFGGAGMLGEKVHAAVLASGVAETGCTVHLVERGAVDDGRILVQRRVPVLPRDDVTTLAARVLAEEHRAIVEAVRKFV